MKKKNGFALTSLALAGLAMGTAHAYESGGVFYDQARVVDVRPIKELVRVATPHQECWTEPVRHVHQAGADPGAYMVTGTIIGGVLGNQIGKGDGRKVATVAGTVLGAMIGNDMGRSRQQTRVTTTHQQHCQTVERYYEEERHAGYRVTYRYQGQEYTRTMAYNPGSTMRVRVAVDPVD